MRQSKSVWAAMLLIALVVGPHLHAELAPLCHPQSIEDFGATVPEGESS